MQLSRVNFPRWKFYGGNCLGTIVQEAIVLGGNCLWGQLSRGRLSGGNYPWGNFLVPATIYL